MSEGFLDIKKVKEWVYENIVTIIFILFTVFGFIVTSGVSIEFFLSDLSSRFFRNAFLVLSLIIPVVAGLGLNFGIVIGAMSGQVAIAIARFFGIGGPMGFLFCMAVSLPVALLCGYLTGRLYNKTRGQEMIAGLIVGYFANGIYLFLFLFVVGVIIKVPQDHFMIKPDGIGVRMSVDLVSFKEGGLKYALDGIWEIPFMSGILVISIALLIVAVIKFLLNKRKVIKTKNNIFVFILSAILCLIGVAVSVNAIATNSSLMTVRKVPVVTGFLIIANCIFTWLIFKTKLGQDFRTVGQSQHIAEVSGINVDRTRIIATMMSTVLAAWGQLIYLQNMGTLNTYNAHTQIGLFSVAALLVGGASTSKANVRHAIFGTILFNSMFIMSPDIGFALFGNALLGEYFRTFVAYGVIGVALGLYVWKNNKNSTVNFE